jgi:hypothetical protein
MSTLIAERIVEDETPESDSDTNCGYLYVGNSPTNYTDPSGLDPNYPILQPGNYGPIYLHDPRTPIPYPVLPPLPTPHPVGPTTQGPTKAGGFGNRFGLGDDFWGWYHRQYKQPGDPDVGTYQEVKQIYDEWVRQGRPDSEGHRTDKPNNDNTTECVQDVGIGLTAGSIIYIIISEGSRLFLPRNLVPVP